MPRAVSAIHYCSYIAAPEGRADFSPWGIPHTDPISTEYIPWRSKSFWLHQIWNLEVPKQQIWALFIHPALSFLGKSKVCMQSLLNQTASNPYNSICYAGQKKTENRKTYSCKKQKSKSGRKTRKLSSVSKDIRSQKALNPKKRKNTNSQCSV